MIINSFCRGDCWNTSQVVSNKIWQRCHRWAPISGHATWVSPILWYNGARICQGSSRKCVWTCACYSWGTPPYYIYSWVEGVCNIFTPLLFLCIFLLVKRISFNCCILAISQIISWEFCARRHEEFVPRRFLAPQVFFYSLHCRSMIFFFSFVNKAICPSLLSALCLEILYASVLMWFLIFFFLRYR